MSVRPVKDKDGNPIPNKWLIDWYPEGRKGKRAYQTVSDVDEATARGIELQLRRRRTGGIKNAANPLIKDVLPDWIAWMRLHRSPKTVESILWALKHLEPHFGPLTVGDINEAVVHQYQVKRKETPRACNLELDYIKSLVTWMVKRKLCNPLPFQIERLRYQRPLPRIPTPEDLLKWIDCLEGDGEWDPEKKRRKPGPKIALIWIMVRCGLRFQEAAGLKWEDVDWNQGIFYYTAKGSRPRIGLLPIEAREILEPYQQEKGLIAPNNKGQPLGNMKSLFRTANKRSGVYIKGPHTLRHICGTYTLAANKDLRLVQQVLGHTQIRTTELYTQVDLERIREAMELTSKYTSNHRNKKD